jgi:hypothetical protein
MYKISLSILFIFIIISLKSQEHIKHDHKEHIDEHGQNNKHDHFHTNEIGVSIAPTAYLQENTIALGTHAHYVHRLGESRFGIGAGFEAVFDSHKHKTLSAVFQYSPSYMTHICVSPGFVQEKHNEMGQIENEYHWALHLELVHEFQLGKIDLGPFFEFALEEEGQHIGIGIHVGLPF